MSLSQPLISRGPDQDLNSNKSERLSLEQKKAGGSRDFSQKQPAFRHLISL
jgi:hypothetical protein